MKDKLNQGYLLIFLTLLLGCSSSKEQPIPELRRPIITNIDNPIATSVEVIWTSNSNSDVEYHIQVATNENFPVIVFQDTIKSVNTAQINNLAEATTYFVRVRSILEDAVTEFSNAEKIITYLEYEEVNTVTSDGLSLNIAIREAPNPLAGNPVLVFCHSVGSSVDEWFKLQSRFLNALRARGYAVLAFDNRSHGKSDPDPRVNSNSVSELLNDPKGIPLDIKAISDYLEGRKSALIGSSMGANLSCVGIGNNELGFSTSIAFSPSSDRVNDLSTLLDSFSLRSSMYFAAENDADRVDQAQLLYNSTVEPRKIVIFENSSSHGSSIITDHPEVWEDVFRWLGENF